MGRAKGSPSGSKGSGLSPRLTYWEAAKTPLHSLLFLLPMVAFYEVGIVWVQRGHLRIVRNGGDVMLRRLVSFGGRPGVAASAVVLVVVLLLWQLVARRSWVVRLRVLGLMGLESVGLAGLLYLFALLYGGRLLEVLPGRDDTLARLPPLAHVVLCFGNGIYEELVFRLLLMGVLLVVLHGLLGLERAHAVWWAVGLSALAFAVAHYVGPLGDEFSWYTFVFRFSAGVFFSAVLAFRGFGVVAGCHAFYDLAVVLSRRWGVG